MRESPGIRVVAIMPSGPAYDYEGGPPPDFSWTNAKGEPVGFWAREWHDLLGAEVLKVSAGYSWESWQPDTRADREYSRRLPTGVVHRLFPAEKGSFRVGLRRQEGLFSRAMLEELARLRGQRVILMLGGTYGFHAPFFRAVLSAFGPGKPFPIFLRSDGMFSHPLAEFPAPHKPLTYASLLLEHFEVKKLLSYADIISEQSDAGLAAVRRVYGGRAERAGVGCDFGFWTPPSAEQKAAARERLGIRGDRLVFFASGNFTPRKRLDVLAEVFSSLPGRERFFLLVAGQGPRPALERLRGRLGPLAAEGSALLHPYAEGEALRELYRASDVYVSPALDEGGPVSVMKAMACGLPVMTTPVGDTADFLKEEGAGRFLPAGSSGAWGAAITGVISGGLPVAVSRSAAEARYGWPGLAGRYAGMLNDLALAHYGERV